MRVTQQENWKCYHVRAWLSCHVLSCWQFLISIGQCKTSTWLNIGCAPTTFTSDVAMAAMYTRTPSFAQISERRTILFRLYRLQDLLLHPRISTLRSWPQLENGKHCSALQVTRSGAISFFSFYDIMHGRKIWILWEYSLTDFPTLSSTAPLYMHAGVSTSLWL